MELLFECITEHTNELIKQRRKKLDFINDNYNILAAPKQRKDMFRYINEINTLNKAIKNIENSLKTIEDIEYGNKE